MKRFYLSKLVILTTALIAGWNMSATAQTVVFGYTGASVAYTVPAGVFSIAVDMYGAAGGNNTVGYTPGYGGRVQCTLATTPGMVLNVTVGGQGVQGIGSSTTAGVGGFNGGGNGKYYYGGGGGGASDIRMGGNTLANRVVVAAGGGGAGWGCTPSNGGAGGGTTGQAGQFCGTNGYSSGYCGMGGTQTTGGTGGTYGCSTTPGTLGVGGDGGTCYYGAGGGGGYYGGGGSYGGGGGGGSSYGNSTLTSSFTTTQGYTSATGNGQVTFNLICTPPSVTAVSGLTNLCGPGVSTPFSYTSSGSGVGGSWFTSDPSVATVSNTGVVTSVGTGVATISYGVTYSCGTAGASAVVTVNPVPATISPSNPTVCAGSTTALTDAGSGSWSSSNTFIAVVGSSSGVLTGVFQGTSTITYTALTGCSTTVVTTVYATPAPIGGVTTICQGQTSLLTNSSAGGVWSSGGTGVATVDATGLVYGATPGSAPIRYTFPGTSCQVSTNVTVNSLPNATYSVSEFPGSGHYCTGGSGISISLPNSDAGVNYQLYNGPLAVYTPVPGTGSGITFGNITTAGTYTVQATNTATGCSSGMSGAATVVVDPLPTAYTLAFVGGATSYCAGGPGLDLQLINSDPGVLYFLYYNSSPTGYFLIGSSGMLDFGYQTTPGTYSVVAQNASTGCTMTMSGTPSLTIDALPDIYNVLGGGNYCAGGAGSRVYVDFSVPGINYTLMNGATPVVTLPGSNSALDFGLQTATGTYTVMAANAITGCTSTMNNAPVIGTNPLPTPYAVSSPTGGAYCTGADGADIELASSDASVNYQLYNGTTAVGSLVYGTGGMLDLGDQTATGSYSILGIDAVTGCTQNMTGTVTVSTLPLPTATFSVTGTGHYCFGGAGLNIGTSNSQTGVNYDLYYGTILMTSIPGTGGPISFGAMTGGLPDVYTVLATNATTTCSVNLTGNATVTIDPLPVQNMVIGGGNYCAGTGGVPVSLNTSDLGITYQLYNGSAVGSPMAGTGSSLLFGYETVNGMYTVIGRNNVTGCTNAMMGSATVNMNTLPIAYTVSGSGSYCSGGAGRHVTLSGSNTGISYQLYRNGTIVNSPMSGTGTMLDFGAFPDAGVYTIVATNVATGCTNTMTGNATIAVNPLPTAFNVTGGGSFCTGGTGVHVGISNSTAGVSYQLWNGTTAVGPVTNGTGAPIDFGVITSAGMYQVTAVNVTTGCQNAMNGSTNITVNPLPTAYSVTGGGTYCSGGSGMHVGLGGSSTGISYQLMMGATAVGSPVTGVTGSALDFGTQTTAGTYTVFATNTITGCTNNMSGNKSITIAALPVVYTVTGGGAFCEGTAGAHVGLSGSAAGVNYQLTSGGANIGSPVAGTGSILDFGAQATSGTYNVVATNAAGCTSNMASGATVVANSLPVAYTITGGGSYCAGGAGVVITLPGSGLGINYQLYNGTTATGLPIGGTGRSLDFGHQTAAGTYKIIATNTGTGCFKTMDGTAAITITPLVTPAVTVSSSMGDTICSGIVSTFSASVINGGSTPTINWMVNGTYAGGGSAISYVAANGDIITAQLISSAACTTSDTVMASKVMMTRPYILPAATITASTPNVVCPGTSVSFSAVASNQGTAPVYTWYKNSIQVGTGTSYSDVPANGDVYVFRVISNQVCRSTDTIFSNTIKMNTQTEPAPVFGITSHLGTVIGVGLVDSLWATVTAGGPNLTYQWFVNGLPIRGATASRFVVNPVFNGDSISCVVTSVGPCGGTSTSKNQIVHLVNVGVQQVSSASDIRVSPNPSKGFFIVKGSLGITDDAEVTIEVTNMLGQVVYNNKVMTHNGDIDEHIQLGSSLSNGMYILSLKSGADSKVFHIVVEK
jgi:hypothetical protein